DQRRPGLQRMGPTLDCAGAGDQRQRPVVADLQRADADGAAGRTHTKRDCSTAALMKAWNSGWGSNGLDFSSGWNWTPTNQGWSGISTISGSWPSGDMPENSSPASSSRSL